MPSSQTDHELLSLMMSGDQEAFTVLYRRLQGKVFRFALRMSGSQAVAEDIVQEVFLTLISEENRYDPKRGSVAAFLYGMARNFTLRRFDREKPYVAMPESPQEDDGRVGRQMILPTDPVGDLARSEEIDSVRRAVLALPSHYREVVVMCDLDEMPYAEAAAIIGCSVGTVRSRLHRARALLIEKLRGCRHGEAEAPAADPARCFV